MFLLLLCHHTQQISLAQLQLASLVQKYTCERWKCLIYLSTSLLVIPFYFLQVQTYPS
jgi:hypothetical protein